MGSPPSVIESPHANTVPGTPHSAYKKPWLLLGLIVLTLVLGIWQAYRAYYKQTLADAYSARQRLGPQQWSGGRVAEWQHLQPVGSWQVEQTFFLTPRYRNNIIGSEVITPIKLQSDEIVLVNRGWIANGVPVPAPPTALPQIETQTWPRFYELASSPIEGRRLQNLTAQRAAALTSLPIAIAYAYQTSGHDDGLLRDWPQPDFKVARHLGYMLTWWSTSICGALLLYRLYKGKP